MIAPRAACSKNILSKRGADRYLLRHETSDPALYAKLHPGHTLEPRLACLDMLHELDVVASELNISRQAVIKSYLRQALDQHYLAKGKVS